MSIMSRRSSGVAVSASPRWYVPMVFTSPLGRAGFGGDPVDDTPGRGRVGPVGRLPTWPRTGAFTPPTT